MLKVKLQYFGHLMQRADSVEKTLMLGKTDSRRKRGWHHWHNGHEFEQTPGVSEGQVSRVCCSPGGCKQTQFSDWKQQLGDYAHLLLSAPLYSLPRCSHLSPSYTHVLVPPQSISPGHPTLPEDRSMYPTAKCTQMLHGPLKLNTSKLNPSPFSLTWAPPVILVQVNGITIHYDLQKPGSHPQHQIDHMESTLSCSWRPRRPPQSTAWSRSTTCSELHMQWNLFATCQDFPRGC